MTRRRRRALALSAVAVLCSLGAVTWQHASPAAEVVHVEAGTSVTELAASHPGAVLVLAPGRHRPFEVRAPVTVRAAPGAFVAGGGSGVVVRETDDVVLDGLVVVGAELHGIEVVDASASIEGCRIEQLASPFAQAIEIRNTNSRPRSSVRRCEVTGGQEGIVSHVSRVEVVDNVVRGTTMRGIAVTEMSEGLVAGNVVTDVAGVGLFCGDMSHCELRDNEVTGVEDAGRGSLSHSGHAVSAAYYSTMRLRGNELSATAAVPVGVYTGSIRTDRFPLSVWPPGWQGGLPSVPIALGAVACLALVRLATQPLLASWSRRHPRTGRAIATGPALTATILGGFAIQSFHMVEHLVQVWQVFVAQSPSRSGLVGASADVEWVHFGFNVLVLAFLVQVWRIGRQGAWLAGGGGAAAWFAAAVFVQGLHLVEHSAKLWQHLTLGIDPAPGIVGALVDLVWLHFAVNTAVWVGTCIAVGSLVRCATRPTAQRRHQPAGRLALVATALRSRSG